MGRPKALLPWFGPSMIEHVVATIAPWLDEVVVVTSRELTLPALDARVVVDRDPARGPLAALRDGLAGTRAERAFVTSTDAPFLTRAHVDALFAAAEAGDRAAAPRAGGFLQVLSAVYPRRAGDEARVLLEAGVERPTALVERLRAEIVEIGSDGPVHPWTGFNTPAEYLALARHRDPGATAEVEWRSGSPSAATPSGPASRAGAAVPIEPVVHRVPIGRLDEVLRAIGADPVGRDLRVWLGGAWRDPARDLALPIGPGERLILEEAPRTAASC